MPILEYFFRLVVWHAASCHTLKRNFYNAECRIHGNRGSALSRRVSTQGPARTYSFLESYASALSKLIMRSALHGWTYFGVPRGILRLYLPRLPTDSLCCLPSAGPLQPAALPHPHVPLPGVYVMYA
eukprot:1157263-Pelagomonas_calceolata.AAC.23